MRLEKPVRSPPTIPNVPNAPGVPKKNRNGYGKVIEQPQVMPERKFTWTPPVLGRPVGLLPYGYVRPEEREDAVAAAEETSTSGSGTDERTSGESSSDNENEDKSGEENSGEDVVYDTDSDVDSDNEDGGDDSECATPELRPSGINFGADLALARAFANKVKEKARVIEIDSD